MSWLFPDRLAGRIALLLALAVLAANVIALILIGLEQSRSDRRIGEARQIERVAALVPAMEAVQPDLRRFIARNASTRFARVRVSDKPIVTATATDNRSQRIARALIETLGRDSIEVAILERPPRRFWPEAGRATGGQQVIAISIALEVSGAPVQYLNIVTNSGAPRLDQAGRRAFLMILSLSLLFVLTVAIVFARRLTRPLIRLAEAADAAGRGDRSARVPETGAREMRQAAAAFNAMQEEISQFDAERMRMLAAVGHDLRTPMTGLRIRAEMVEDQAQRDAMIRALDEMTVMADGLVTYAREGRDSETPVKLDLRELLEEMCQDRGVPFSCRAEVSVEARPVALRRAIGNLIDNALRYANSAEVSLDQADGQAVIHVEDDGPGLPEDQISAMFQPFARGENSRNLGTGGAGLGLSIARGIVLAHGGTITLENRETGGLLATVRLRNVK